MQLTLAPLDALVKLLEAGEQGNFASKVASATFWASWAVGQVEEDAHPSCSVSKQALRVEQEEKNL